jgi:hypothetical protein
LAHTQDFSETVVPITSVKIKPTAKLGRTGKLSPSLGIDAGFGTGFCLDAACRFIVTNYHVAAASPRAHKIRGEEIFQRYFATGPQDRDATANTLSNGEVLAYAVKRDLAIFELRRPLPHHHGLTFSLDELEFGQEVDIYAYPTGALLPGLQKLYGQGIINPVRKLTRYPAKFKGPTTVGLLAFEYQFSADKPILGGASGGIVVDGKTEKILGILCGKSETWALAVPVQTLVDFVHKAQPFLAQTIFPTPNSIAPVSADLYPRFAPPSDRNPQFVPVRSDELRHRPEEPYEVSVLRNNAQLLADSMRNYIAVQTFEWGSGNQEPAAEAEYQVRVVDGVQKFRDGKNESEKAPRPYLNSWVLPSDEWSTLPNMVGTEWKLKVRQAADAAVNQQPIKVFQYYASVEDNLCPFEPVEDFGLFTISKAVAVACYGEVWTDKDLNILRISEHLDLSDKLKAYRGWEDFQIVLTYGWLKQEDEVTRLVPLTIYTQSKNGSKVYWCRGQFTDYHVFSSKVKILAKQPGERGADSRPQY